MADLSFFKNQWQRCGVDGFLVALEIGGGVGPIVVMGGCWVCFCFLVTAGSGGGGWLASNGGWPMIT